MWPFKRNKKQDSVPPEVQEYYQAEKRERVGIAWALAFITLAVTIGVVLGLFFGGRALYHHFQKAKPTTTEQTQKPSDSNIDSQSSSNNSSSSSNSSNSSSSSSSSNQTSQPSQTTTPATPAPSNSPKPNQTITNTGPGETAAAGFAIASIVGFTVYQLHLRRKLTD
jgi:cytoskeletal protein RodZ